MPTDKIARLRELEAEVNDPKTPYVKFIENKKWFDEERDKAWPHLLAIAEKAKEVIDYRNGRTPYTDGTAFYEALDNALTAFEEAP